MSREDTKMYFSPLQLKWLYKMFPQRVLPTTASIDEVRHYFGQQSVIATIRENVSAEC